jgi:hypothetical protein
MSASMTIALDEGYTSHGTMATPASLTSTVSGRPEHFNFLVRQASQARAVTGRFPVFEVVEGPASFELMT